MKKLNILLLALAATFTVSAIDMKDLKIYVNPGHGGHESDDRNVVVPPFAPGDPEGFWESNASLEKGLHLRDILQSFGTNVMMSRTTNNADDDRDLHEIGYEANAFGSDFMFAIHSNATGSPTVKNNQPLMLYRGYTDEPQCPEAKEMCLVLNLHLLENEVTSWSNNKPWHAGDWTFYDWGTSGLGVLRKLTVPGMLSEGSFHDYIPETYRLLNSDYCWLEAYHFAKAVQEHFNTRDRFTTGVVCGSLYDSRLIRTEEIYRDKFFGHDKSRPICGATASLIQGGKTIATYKTDDLFNGVYMFRSVQPGEYTLKIEHPEYHAVETPIVVTADKVVYKNFAMDRIRKTAPEVVSYSPLWKEGDDGVVCNSRIEINFNWDMDTQSVEENFSITPAVEGTLSWEDSQYRLVFTPKRAFDTNTLYTVKINKAAKHPANISMVKDFVFQFKSGNYNEFKILAQSPASGEKVHFKAPIVEFRFETHPNTSYIQNEIIIKDDQGKQMAYNVRSKKFSKVNDPFGFFQIKLAKDLVVGKTYTVEVSETLRDHINMPVLNGQKYTFTAVDADIEGAKLTKVVPFQTAGILAFSDMSNAKTCTVNTSSKQKLNNRSSYEIKYTFEGLGTGVMENSQVAVAKFVTMPDVTFNNTNSIGLKLYGDLSKNFVVVRLVNGEKCEFVKIAQLDWLGWKDCSVSLANLPAGDYKVESIAIAQNGGEISKAGAVYVDCLTKGAAGDAGIENVESADLRIYPNPASELLIANMDEQIMGIELYSIDGKLVSQVSGNVMNVSEVAEGLYIAKVYSAYGYGTKHIVVKH